jgi:hypothetical protein
MSRRSVEALHSTVNSQSHERRLIDFSPGCLRQFVLFHLLHDFYLSIDVQLFEQFTVLCLAIFLQRCNSLFEDRYVAVKTLGSLFVDVIDDAGVSCARILVGWNNLFAQRYQTVSFSVRENTIPRRRCP